MVGTELSSIHNLGQNPALLGMIPDAAVSPCVVSGLKNPLWQRAAERIWERVNASGMTRKDLAALTDISHVALVNVENGVHVPRLRTLERIADGLGISPVWLAYGDEGGMRFRHRRPFPRDVPPVPHPDNRPPVDRWRGVGERLASARAMKALTLRAVATAAGVSPQAILLIERGESEPRISTVEEIAVALDVAPGWLAYGEGEGPEAAEG